MNFSGTIRLNRYGVLLIAGVVILFIYYIHSIKMESNDISDTTNLRKLLIGSVEAAINGGKEVVEVSKSSDFETKSKGKTNEGANDPVTNADYKSHCAMYHGLHKMFPKVTVISEENFKEENCANKMPLELDATLLHANVHELVDSNIKTEDITIWIDPLDATQEYTEKLFKYVTTMVCVAVKGKPVIGIIHFPFSGTTSWAWIGNTASADLLSMTTTSNAGMPKSPTVVVSRSHAGDVKNITKIAFGNDVNVVGAAGAGYKAMQVAKSEASVYMHTTNIKKWDLCAANAILNYLGGSLTTLSNDEIDYSNTNDPLSKGGVLATLQNHEWYINKLKNVVH